MFTHEEQLFSFCFQAIQQISPEIPNSYNGDNKGDNRGCWAAVLFTVVNVSQCNHCTEMWCTAAPCIGERECEAEGGQQCTVNEAQSCHHALQTAVWWESAASIQFIFSSLQCQSSLWRSNTNTQHCGTSPLFPHCWCLTAPDFFLPPLLQLLLQINIWSQVMHTRIRPSLSHRGVEFLNEVVQPCPTLHFVCLWTFFVQFWTSSKKHCGVLVFLSAVEFSMEPAVPQKRYVQALMYLELVSLDVVHGHLSAIHTSHCLLFNWLLYVLFRSTIYSVPVISHYWYSWLQNTINAIFTVSL